VFFDNALKGGWKESHGKVVRIPEASPGVFAMYAKFLLTGLLFLQSRDPSTDAVNIKDVQSLRKQEAWSCLCLLQLADFLQASSFQDAIVDACIETLAEQRKSIPTKAFCFSSSMTNSIYRYSANTSPFRKFVVDLFLHTKGSEFHHAVDATFDPNFLLDLIKATSPYVLSEKHLQEISDPVNTHESCKYHEHTLRGEPCYKIKHLYLHKKSTLIGMQSTVLPLRNDLT
jgi:hypothetical protein